MPRQEGPDARKDGRAVQKTPARTDANRPMARAMQHARQLAGGSQVAFAAALEAVVNVPIDHGTVSGWEVGVNGKPYAQNWNFVPAYALVAAAEVAHVSVGALLTMAGVEGQDPYQDQLADLRRQVADLERVRRRQEMIEEALNELRADRGLPPLPATEEGIGE